jgi:hypothetical protein
VGLRASGESPGESQRIAAGDELIALAKAAQDEPAGRGAGMTELMIDGVREGEGRWYVDLPDMEIVATGRIRVTVEDGVITAEVHPTDAPTGVPPVSGTNAIRRSR